MMKISDDYAKKKLEEDAENVSGSDVRKVINKQKETEDKFSSGGPLGGHIEDVKLLFSVIKDYWIGEYRGIPWGSIAAIAAALLYVINPIDLIPDSIPIIGLVDDALVIAACLSFVKQDLQNYKQWKLEQA